MLEIKKIITINTCTLVDIGQSIVQQFHCLAVNR